MLFVGPAGIGKSALAEHLGQELSAQGAHIETVRCSEMTSAVPFAPLLHLAPEATGLAPPMMGRALLDSLHESAQEEQLVVIVEDLQHSDPGTASVIFTLLTQSDTKLIASTRSISTTDAAVKTLWKDGLVDRIDLPRLGDDALVRIAERLCEASLTPLLRTELTRRADGNPMFLSALARTGLSLGAIQPTKDGYCDLVSDFPASAEVNDLLQSQLEKLSVEQRQLVELIAIGEHMPVELFGDVHERRLIEELALNNLVVIDYDTPAHATRCAHPLVGEYVRSKLNEERTRSIHGSLVRRIERLGAPTPLDLMRAASLAVSEDIDISADLLLTASAIALNVPDPDLALRTALRASNQDETGHSDLLAGAALAMIGEVELANHHFATAETYPLTDQQVARLAISRSNMAVFFEADPAKGEHILRAAYDEAPTSELQLELGTMMLFPLAMGGRNDEAIELGHQLAQLPTSKPQLEVAVLATLSMVKFMVADFEGLPSITSRARSVAEVSGASTTQFDGLIAMAEVSLLKRDADLRAATEMLKSSSDLYVVNSQAGVSAAWSSMLTTIQTMTGDMGDALQHTAIALEDCAAADDPMGMIPMLEAARSVALILSGRADEASEAYLVLTPEYATKHRRAAHWRAWADAWMAGQHDPPTGAKLAAEKGAWSGDNGMDFWSWDLLHTAVRLGHPELVVEDLAAAALRSPAPLVQLFARHAQAGVDNDEQALIAVANEFAEIGAWACSAEAWASVALASSNAAQAGRYHVKGTQEQRKCSGIVTPLLLALNSPLSDNESEVAALAATGMPSKAIAEQRFVSTRTVDNQLRAVYKKLELAGRAELPLIFST